MSLFRSVVLALLFSLWRGSGQSPEEFPSRAQVMLKRVLTGAKGARVEKFQKDTKEKVKIYSTPI
jgi:hypothetical protein